MRSRVKNILIHSVWRETRAMQPPHGRSSILLHLFSLFFFLFFSITTLTVSASPRLGAFSARRREILKTAAASSTTKSLPDDFQTFLYPQILDHFNYKPESYTTFDQRYAINFKYWGGGQTNAPIFAFLCEESAMDYDLSVVGFLTDNAPRFKALLVFIEHRYYGKSIPFGSTEEALRNASSLGYFNSAQALADYAAVLMHIKKNVSAHLSPVIVIGGSYGGLLASWFRLKYPHVALGAVASSAPILYFDDIAPQSRYYSVVTKDFKETSESCYQTIRKSWSKIDKVASKPNGLAILSKKFKTCKPLEIAFELKDYLDSIYADAAQYNEPETYPVSLVCGAIDGAYNRTGILRQIFAGVVAYMGNRSCYDMNEFSKDNSDQSRGWRWQTCSEMVMPIGHDNKDSMFPPAPFNLSSYIMKCKSLFGVLPQPHWLTTYYGCHDLKLILRRFASNIIFSNGLGDPHSSGGVLENISDSIVAVTTVNGSHCLDILPARETDPEWLVAQRKTEVEIIRGWLSKYYSDLQDFKEQTHV